MKMTLEDTLMWPKGMRLEEYQKLLTSRANLMKKLHKLSDERDLLEDGLEVLDDERGSDRWLRKAQELDFVIEQMDKATAKLEAINAKLGR